MWSALADLGLSVMWYYVGHMNAKSKYGKFCKECGDFLDEIVKTRNAELDK